MRCLARLPLLTLAAAAPADERSYLVTSFERLRVEGPVEVEMVAGSPAASASGERRALDALEVRVEAGTMTVRSNNEWQGVPRVRVATPALRAVLINGGGRARVAAVRGNRVDLSVSGAGSLDVADVAAGDLVVTLTGTGAINLAGKAERARVQSYGTGSVEAARLTAGEATLVSQSSGNIEMAARYLARATAFGTGAIRVSGSPECKVAGPGPVTCGPARN